MNPSMTPGMNKHAGISTLKITHIRNTKKIVFSIFFLLAFMLSHAQTFSNLGFEYWQGNKFPLFWQHPGIAVSSDSVTKFSGSYSLKALRQPSGTEAAQSPYGLIFQNVLTAFNYIGIQNKTFEVSVRVKSNFADTSAFVQVFIQMADPLNPKNNHIAMGNKVAHRQEWTKSAASIAIEKTSPATTILMGVIMAGQGEMWLDDFKIECDGRLSEEVYPRTAELTGKEKKWLTSNLIPISGEVLSHRKQFSRKIAGARIVGIGDNVHGSASLFKLKNIISKDLFENEGFTMLAIEDSPSTGEAVNRYVLGLSELGQNEMNVMYDNTEFKNMLSWLRTYNRSAAKKIRVFGVDVNSRYEKQIEYLDQATMNKYSFPLDSIDAILKSAIKIWDYRSNERIPFTDGQRQYIKSNIEQIKSEVARMNAEQDQKILLTYYANSLLNYLTYNRREREKQMADNIEWLHAQYPNEKMVYLAHNSHVGNDETPVEGKRTGAWLKEKLGNKYYIIGTCYFDGTDLYKKTALQGSQPNFNEAVKGSYEYLFHQMPEPCFYLDLSKLTGNPSNQWLFQPMLMRNYGIEPFNYYHEFSITDLTRQYDGIVFIKTSVPL